jgi:ribosomal protein L32E
MLLMYNRTYAAEIGKHSPHQCKQGLADACVASAVGARKRAEIVQKAKKLGVVVTNGNARLAQEE